jgi:hypothetical protein
MTLGAWLALRPHQLELFDSAGLGIEPPACTGTDEYSSKRNLRRRGRCSGADCQRRHGGGAQKISANAPPFLTNNLVRRIAGATQPPD